MFQKMKIFFMILVAMILYSCENNTILENEEFLELNFCSIADGEFVSENSGIIISFSDSLNLSSLEADSIYDSLMVFNELVELEIKKIESSKKVLFNGQEQTIWYDEKNKTATLIKETDEFYPEGVDSIFLLRNSNILHIESNIRDIYGRHLSEDLNLSFFLDTTIVSIPPSVLPNPYFGYSTIEPSPQDKRIVFFHLPDTCAIIIYNSQGDFINSLTHTSQINDGSETWDVKNFLGEYVNPGIYQYEIHSSTERFLNGVLVIAAQVSAKIL